MDSVIEWTKPQRWLVPGHGMPAEPRMDGRFEPLATYNAERMRGIVHTPEYAAKMAELQREFNATPVGAWMAGERTGVRTADNRQSPTATTPGAATGR